jgi:hypothetical protein
VIDRLCGGEAERDIATAVPPKRTQPRQAGATPLDDAFELTMLNRRIGGKHHDD